METSTTQRIAQSPVRPMIVEPGTHCIRQIGRPFRLPIITVRSHQTPGVGRRPICMRPSALTDLITCSALASAALHWNLYAGTVLLELVDATLDGMPLLVDLGVEGGRSSRFDPLALRWAS
jgi:hypothetical protein